MIDEVTFESLLKSPEGERLDFKSQSYVIDEDGGLKLVKDVLAMANTPRDGAAFIVLGVEKRSDGTYSLTGITDHPDEALLQQQFADRVHPVPRFTYYALTYGGMSFGVIEIDDDRIGPCVALRDFKPHLREKAVYFRRGSRNDTAGPEDLHRILGWLNSSSARPAAARDVVPAWEDFEAEIAGFDPLRSYMLFLSPLPNAPAEVEFIGLAPWSCVFDFDPDSDSLGALTKIRKSLGAVRGLHLTVKGERQPVNPSQGTRWFFVRGLRGRKESLAEGRWFEWKQVYGNEVLEQMERTRRELSPRSVVLVVIWADITLNRHLQTCLEAAVAKFGRDLSIVFVEIGDANLQGFALELESSVVRVPLAELCRGIKTISWTPNLDADERTILPSSSGAPIELSDEERAWLGEDLELVHLGVGTVRPAGRDIGNDFLRGHLIDWYELGLHFDVPRDKTGQLERRLQRDLDTKQTTRLNLYHSPGAGGTTIGRRLAWQVHKNYPSVLLHRYSGDQTTERLYRIASLTGQSLLVVCDGSSIADREVEDLYSELKSRQIGAVVLQILRRFDPHEDRRRSFFLSALLTSVESERFATVFGNIAPGKRSRLEFVARSSDEKLRTPFYFALEAFGREFVGLESYVRTRTEELTEAQRKVIGMVALVHHFGQKAVPAQIFRSTIGLAAEGKLPRLERLMTSGALELLVEEAGGRWRAVHELVASEILEQILGSGFSDRRSWNQRLSLWAGEFIRLCRDATHGASDEIVDILSRLLIYRDNVDLLGSERAASRRFAQLLEEIPSREGRLTVLRELVDAFPEEAHFWAHIGRFFSLEMQNFEEALVCIERSLEIQDDDHVLHHMKGMALRKQVEDLMRQRCDVREIVPIATDASDAFAAARERGPDDEHGYISEVQMLAAILDYAGRGQSGGMLKFIASSDADPYLRGALERAEDLLEQVRRGRQGERPSSFEMDCRGKLDALYGRHEEALQTWDSLLSREGVYRPSLRRQIVWTYLARRDRTWSRMKPKEIERSVGLLESNLEEEPYRDRDLRLWLQAVRYSNVPRSLEAIIERVAYWRASAGTLDAVYYLYVLHALLAIEGSDLHLQESERFLAESRQMARHLRNRTKSFEWLGSGDGIRALVHQSELGEWSEEADFWGGTQRLARIVGRIEKINSPQAGQVEVEGGLRAFFVPARGEFFKGRSENENVSCYLGFSYDGLRAWGVSRRDGELESLLGE